MKVALGVLATLVTSSAGAEEMVALTDILSKGAEMSYQNVRCGAFYLANIEWAGQALAEDVFENSKSLISSLLLVATLQRTAKVDGDVEHLASTVNTDARVIADLYLESFRRSYALRGSAWEGNALWESDLETCKPIGEVALLYKAELEQETQ